MSDENTRSRFIAAANFLTAVHGPGFTLQDLYDEANLTKTDFRRVFRSKTELLAASGHEEVSGAEIEPPREDIEPPLEKEERHEPVFNVEMAGQNEGQHLGGPDIAMEREAEKPERTTEETEQETEPAWPAGDEHWIDRRFRILERAISSLEIQIADLQALQKKISDSAANSEPPPRAETAAYPKEIDLPELPPVVETPYPPFEPPPLVAGSPAIFAEVPETKSGVDMASGPRSRNREREALAAHWSVADEVPDHKPSRMIVILALAIMCGILAGILTSTLHAGASKHAAQSAIAISKVSPVQALLDQANKGDSAAQTKLAIAYMQGAGVKPDLGTAIHWAEAAASQGNVDAKYLLGALMRAGAKPDLAMAAHWYQEAAEGGNVKAMHNFGIALLNGTGIPKDEAGAVQWFERAANLGYRDSQFDLAVLYERGEGVSQNPSEALRWYEKAAASGDVEAAQRATWLRQNVRQLASR